MIQLRNESDQQGNECNEGLGLNDQEMIEYGLVP